MFQEACSQIHYNHRVKTYDNIQLLAKNLTMFGPVIITSLDSGDKYCKNLSFSLQKLEILVKSLSASHALLSQH